MWNFVAKKKYKLHPLTKPYCLSYPNFEVLNLMLNEVNTFMKWIYKDLGNNTPP